MRTLTLALGLSFTLLAACGDDDTSGIDARISIPDAAPTIDSAPAIDSAPVTPDAGMAYGSFTTASFTSGYIFGAPPVQADITAHPTGAQNSAAFTGTYTDAASAVPPTGAAASFSFAFHATGATPYLMVQQQSQSATAIIAPVVVLQFKGTSTAVGTVNLGVTSAEDAALFLVDPTASNCVKAVGIGTLNVTTATTTDVEGGTLAFTGSAINLYHPTLTPAGDVSSMFTSVCPR